MVCTWCIIIDRRKDRGEEERQARWKGGKLRFNQLNLIIKIFSSKESNTSFLNLPAHGNCFGMFIKIINNFYYYKIISISIRTCC